MGSSESGYGSASSEGKALTERMPNIYSELKSDNYRMQHMQKSSDGVSLLLITVSNVLKI